MTRPLIVVTARLVCAAAVLLSLVSTRAAARSPDSPPSISGMAAPSQAQPQRALAAWRHARGLDRPDMPFLLTGAVPVRALGGGDPDDVQWQAGFGLPVPDGLVTALLPMENVLVVGGYFTGIGDLAAPGIATWDGTQWSTLGAFPGGYIQDVVPHLDGLLALSVWPTVWRWDGTAWSTLPYFPADPGSPVYYANEIATQDGQVAVAVSTWTEGLGYRARVYLMGDDGWIPLGGYFSVEVINAMAWYQGRLYVAGRLQDPTGPAALVNFWDGTAWQPAGPELSRAQYDQVRSLAVYGGELVAGGWFHSTSDFNTPATYFASWNGTRWAPLGTGQPASNLQRLRVIGSNLYALGLFNGDHQYGIARWDGATWHTGEDHLRWMAHDIASFGGEMYAGGSLSADGPMASSPLARLRDGRWQPPLTPGDGMQGLMGWDGPGVSVLAAVDGGIVAGGRLDFAGAPGGWVPFTGSARWDGTRWSALGDRSWDDIYFTDLASHQGALYATGFFRGGTNLASVARFEDGRWVQIGGYNSPFSNVYRLTSAFGKLFVGGGIDAGATGGVACWDGATWSGVGGGISKGNYISSMTTHGDELVVGGDFTEMSGVPCRYVAAWNPRDGWHALGDGLDGTVSDLISRDGVLYASMLLCGPPGLARWKNGQWERLDSPTQVWALGWYRGRLVASSDQFCGGIAYRNATGAWHPLGSGLNGVPYSFVEQDQSLFVGGRFSRAGGKAAFGFAEWRGPLPGDDGSPPPPDPAPDPAPAPIARLAAEPNPSAAAIHLRYSLPAASHARIEIYDLSGHLVQTVFEGEQSAGAQDVIWTPNASRVSAGVYFARVTAGALRQVVRVVRVE
jgi:trimeric autotransporter adhesin